MSSSVNNGCVLHTSLDIFAYTEKNVTLSVYWIFHQTKNQEKKKNFSNIIDTTHKMTQF